MNVVLTGAGSDLGRELHAALSVEHQVHCLDSPPPGDLAPALDAGLWTTDLLLERLRGMDAVVHLAAHGVASPRLLPPEQALLDVGGRITFNLLNACRELGVNRFLYVSTLELLAGYDPDWILHETFEPRPTTDPRLLSFACGERLVRNARQQRLYWATIARLGLLVKESEVAGQPYNPLWLDRQDAVDGLAAVLRTGEMRHWWGHGVVHLCAERPDALSAVGALGHWCKFHPQHNFGYVKPEVTA